MSEKILVTPMSLEEAKKLGIESWSEWSCKPSAFDWCYSDKETAYVFEGDVIVTAYGEQTHISDNCLVVFPKGMECVWDVRKTIRKVYKFGD